jgi:hypothetical protein
MNMVKITFKLATYKTRSGLITLDVHPGRMEEYRFVLSKASKSGVHHIPRAGQTRLCMSDNAVTLPPFRL